MNPSERIDQYIDDLEDWRGETLAAIRETILSADKQIIEGFKWMGSPVWECDGLIAVCDAHKAKVKLTFAYGAKLPDPDKIFNGKDTGATRRSIDFFEGDRVGKTALRTLVRAAIAFNHTNLKKNAPKASGAKSTRARKA